jgi:hypothetical protein
MGGVNSDVVVSRGSSKREKSIFPDAEPATCFFSASRLKEYTGSMSRTIILRDSKKKNEHATYSEIDNFFVDTS